MELVRFKEAVDVFPLDQTLDEGGCGKIFLLPDKKQVIKVIRIETKSDLELVFREAVIGTKLAYPHFVPVSRVIIGNNAIGLVMPLGKNADSQFKKMVPKDVLKHARVMLGAIQELHHSGLLHLDVKLPNMLLFANNCLCLCDWGFCVPDGVNVVQRFYTPGMIRPGEDNACKDSDFYALVITIIEMMLACIIRRNCVPMHDRSMAYSHFEAEGTTVDMKNLPLHPLTECVQQLHHLLKIDPIEYGHIATIIGHPESCVPLKMDLSLRLAMESARKTRITESEFTTCLAKHLVDDKNEAIAAIARALISSPCEIESTVKFQLDPDAV